MTAPSGTAKKKNPPRTLADVAKALNVDPSTVSLVLSGSPKISEKTTKRVLDYCAKVNFYPNTLARGLSRGKSGIWGILFPSIQSSFFPQVLEGIEEVVNEAGMTSFLGSYNMDLSLLRRQLASMASKRVEGLLIAPSGLPGEKEILDQFVDQIPTVYLLGVPPNVPWEHCIRVDNELGAYLGTKHLIQRGHKRIAFLDGPEHALVLKFRKNGWVRALEEAGLEADPNLIRGNAFSVASGREATEELLEIINPPTGFMASSDYSALGAIQALFRRKMLPNPNIGVVGFDGICCGSYCPIPLTTISQPKKELGYLAAKTLQQIINGEKPEMQLLEPKLIIRRSCGSQIDYDEDSE